MRKNQKPMKDKMIDLLVQFLEMSMQYGNENLRHTHYRRIAWRELQEEKRKVRYLQKIIERNCPHKKLSDTELTKIVNRFLSDKDDEVVH